MELNRIIYYSQQVSLLKEFYQQHFNFQMVEDIENEWVVLNAGGTEIAFHRAGEAWRSIPRPGHNSNVKIVFKITGNLEVLRSALLDKGVPLGEIKSYPGFNYTLCDGQDPEGNMFQLMQVAHS